MTQTTKENGSEIFPYVITGMGVLLINVVSVRW